MAHEQRKSIRWMARIGTWMARVWPLFLIAVKAFLNFKEEDGLWEKGMKTADLTIRRAAYFVADYGLWAVSVAIFTAMKASGFSLVVIFGVLWIFEFMAAGVFILFYEKTGVDFSLGADFRRARDIVSGESRVAGYLLTLFVLVLAVVWTGPEKIITFFRKEIGSISRVVVTTLVLTCIQAGIWAVLYDLGYGLVAEFL